jgi:hypothetical protein
VHFEAHATLGWAIGNLGGGDRRLRNYCVLGAILPDIDATPYLFGPQAYGDWHHTFGHNVFLWAAFGAWVTWKSRSWRAAILGGLSFGSHLLTDAQLSGWVLYLFWPLSSEGYLFPGAVGLDAPINYWLVYLSPVVVVILAVLFKRTPVDIVSPALDRMIIAFFREKRLGCGSCSRKCNQLCDNCGTATCIRHANITRRFRLLCPICSKNTEASP